VTLETKIPPRPEKIIEKPDSKQVKTKIAQVDKKIKKRYDEREGLYQEL
jgi:hypothetical protein